MTIRTIRPSDIPGLNHLPPLDWKFDYEQFLKDFAQENFFHAFVLVEKEKIVGTGNVLLKNGVGWLANIIVEKNYRRRGLGFKITKYLVDFLNSQGCKIQLLLASELGKPVYKKIGFRTITNYRCFDVNLLQETVQSDAIRKLTAADLKKVAVLDQQANGENRNHLIYKFSKNGLGYFAQDQSLLGCYLPSFGRGMVLAKSELVGIELLKIKHGKNNQRTLLPIENNQLPK